MSEQRNVNARVWRGAGASMVREYRRHELRTVERVILERHRHALAGPVLEIGVGGGRLTERLVEVSAHVTGIDLAPAMVEHCRVRFPQARFEVADLLHLGLFDDAAFAAVIAGYNVIDVLAADERLDALREWRRVLAPGGLLVMSSHNLHAAAAVLPPGRLFASHPRRLLGNILRRRRRLANHRRLAQLEQHGDGWAILNDEAHDHALLHYYADRRHVERQLADAGFSLIECLDLAGETVGPGEQAPGSPELHYCARSSPPPGR